MAKQVKRSVLPIYLVGAAWLVYAALFPLRTLGQYLICAAVSAVVFVAGKAVFPDKVYQTPDAEEKPKEEKPTGNPEVDALLKERERALSEMRRLNDSIADEKISAQIDTLDRVLARSSTTWRPSPKSCPRSAAFWTTICPPP